MSSNESLNSRIDKQFTMNHNASGDFVFVSNVWYKKSKLCAMQEKLASVQKRLETEIDPICVKRCNEIIKNLSISIDTLKKDVEKVR